MRKRGRLIQIASYIRPDQFKRLKKLVDKTKVSMAEYVRQAIEILLKRFGV